MQSRFFFSIIKEILGGLNMAFKFKKLFEDNDDEMQSVSEDEFYSFVGASYLFAKKISDYSLPYLLIK